jgi:Gluconate 2-dehydrogenase subunit 3
MNRREALSSVALLLGGTLIGSEMFLSGCTNENKKIGTAGLDFSPEDISFLDEVGDTIIPATDSPGAKDAKIGEFMHTIVRDCYNKTDQDIFIAGMAKLNETSKTMNGKYFLESNPEERKNLLIALDKEQKEYTAQKKAGDPAHYFRMIKELTIWGYFTSEPGATKALRYIAVPGKYEGCIPYKKGDKAWAT